MSQVLNKLRDVDPNNSEAIKEALSPFFQQLAKHTEVECRPWLRALEGAITRFPKYCMSQRGNIETYLAHFLDSNNYNIVIEAAKCAHVLQQVRPTQEKTATAKSCWRDQMNALCNAAQMLLGAIFPNAVDIYQQIEKIQKEQQSPTNPLATALSQLSSTAAKTQNKTVNKQALMCTRLQNVFVFIQAMLVEIYPVAKPIRPQTILDVIVRALSVSSGNNANQNLADIVTVKTEALRCLDALIVCLGPNLIPFSPLVFRFVMQTLKWCSDNPSEKSRKVRCAAYSSLNLWLSSLHTHRVARDRGTCWEEELTDHIIADITPYKHVVELKMSSQPTKNLSKKAKRKLANSMLQDSNISSHMPGEKNKVADASEVNDDVAIAALECAETFLIVCGIFLTPTTHKRFQERLVRECNALYQYSATRALKLLRALEAARKCAPSNVPPPTQYCLHIYSVNVNSEHRQISNLCSQALLDIRMHLHCSPPSLNYAIEVRPDTSKQENKRQISEKNRAALEALLGADKVPKQMESEEVITITDVTITDEPSHKKRKIVDSDKISVSSEASIEISDDSDIEDSVVREVQVVIENVDSDGKTGVLPDEADPVVEDTEMNDDIQKEDEQTIDITQDDDIHNQQTQLPTIENDISEDKVDSTQPESSDYADVEKMSSNVSLYEAATQLPPNLVLPLNIPNDDDDESPLSLEVVYDYPNDGNEKVTVLEKLDGDNLPSTNETDDIQITCGQVVKNSQDLDLDSKKANVESKNVNGIDNPEKPLQNGDVSESGATNASKKDLNVEDMLADFVDEVNEDTQSTQAATQV